jgi:DNA-directed RNA polymerase specialized sigma24 family protein
VIARNTVVAGYLDDAKRIAGRYRTDNADDLEQDAAEAKYAAEHEAAFSTFMYEVVEKRCIDSLRRHWRHKRLVSTESIAEKNEAVLGPYAGNPVKPARETKIFRELFENT